MSGFVYPCVVGERCQLCGARWRKGALKCRDCGAPKRNTVLPEEPAGAPLPDAAASLATEPVPDIQAFADESTSSAPAMADDESDSNDVGAPTIPLSAEPTIPVHTPDPSKTTSEHAAPESAAYDSEPAAYDPEPAAYDPPSTADSAFDAADPGSDAFDAALADPVLEPHASTSSVGYSHGHGPSASTSGSFESPASTSGAAFDSAAAADPAYDPDASSAALDPTTSSQSGTIDPSPDFDAALDAAASASYAAMSPVTSEPLDPAASSPAMGSAASHPGAAGSSPGAIGMPGAMPQAVPGAPSAPLPRPGGGRGPLLFILIVLVLAVGGGAAFFLLRKPEPPAPSSDAEPEEPISIEAPSVEDDRPSCTDVEALEGAWVFTTATTNARKEARIGMRGFFEMQVDVTDCKATASLVKIGRKGKPTFAEHKRPRATATLEADDYGLYAFGFGALFDLQNADGQGVPLRITFAREGEQLVGAWRQMGPRWDSSGMYGVLVGEREGDPRKLRVRRSEQPCTVQCAAPQSHAEIEQPDLDAIAACRSACG